MLFKQILKLLLNAKTKRSIKEQLGVPGLHKTLMMLKQRGYQPKFVIDGGAYEGQWALNFLEVYANAKILMIEAQAAKISILEGVTCKHPNVKWHQAILAAEDRKKVIFSENETASHVKSEADNAQEGISCETLDGIINRFGYIFPDFIKLDVQGYELEVLKGAPISLAHAEFCLLEVTLIGIANEPLMADVIRFMDEQGFQAYDICEFIRRPYDKALYQIDLLFIRKSSPFIAVKRWD
ncbi:MAG TPA: FkbM family methyltransferase [Chitinophagaceae bacterium]|nr:FkbM family methyltransferase [Chitinophagaceae bacterium]